MNTAVAKQQPKSGIAQAAEYIADDKFREKAKRALAGVAGVDEFTTQLTIDLTTNEAVQGCTFKSLGLAAATCCGLGLLPSLRQVALIPRKLNKVDDNGRKQWTGQWECTVMPEYRGYLALMLRHPNVVDITARLVHVSDTYRIDNRGALGAFIAEHNFDPLASDRTIKSLGDLKGGYVRVVFRDGSEKHHFVHVDHILKARDCAQTKDVWDRWPEQQALKTLMRDLFNRNVIAFDPLHQKKLTELGAMEDSVLGNDPNRVVLPAYQPPRIESSAAQSRSNALVDALSESNADPVLPVLIAEPERSSLQQRAMAMEEEHTIDELESEGAITPSEERAEASENTVEREPETSPGTPEPEPENPGDKVFDELMNKIVEAGGPDELDRIQKMVNANRSMSGAQKNDLKANIKNAKGLF